jgi:hypothetical protein
MLEEGMMKLKSNSIFMLVVLAVFSRLLPHPWNWTAVGAASIFAGLRFENRLVAVLVPLVSLMVSDWILGFHETMFWTWGAFAAMTLLAKEAKSFISPESSRASELLLASMASVFFFVVVNFGFWLQSGFYPMSANGLFLAYVAGLPFLSSQIAGDIFFMGVLLGAEWIMFSASRRRSLL